MIKVFFVLIFFSGLTGSVFAQTSSKTEIPVLTRENDSDYKREREVWINQMHRAEPGLNWQTIDAETRSAKFDQLQFSSRKHSLAPLGLIHDTLAGGRITGLWSERGSKNISGRMHTVDIDFDHNVIYAASAMGNIWKADLSKTDSWTSLNDNHRFGGVVMLRVITTSKGKRLIAAANGPATVYYSDDEGITWQTASGLDGPKSWGGFKRACINATEQTIYLFGNEWDYKNWYAVSTLYRSTDQGKSFTNLGKWKASSDKSDVWLSRDTISPVFFLKNDSLLTIDVNGKMNFIHQMIYSDSIGKIGSLLLQGAVKNNSINLAVLETTKNVGTISVSSNGGKAWEQTGTFAGSIFGNNSFKMLQSDPQTMAIGTIETFISHDNGTSWDHTNGWGEYYGDMKTKLHADIDGIDFIRDPIGNEIECISTDGGIFLSKDTLQTFENITLSGVGTSQYYSVLTSEEAPYFIYGGTQDQGYQRAQDSSARTEMTQTISGDYGHLSSSNKGRSTWCDYPGFALLYTDAKGNGRNSGWGFQGKNHLWMPPIIADPLDSSAAYIACGGDLSESFIWHLKNIHRADKDTIEASHLSFDFSGGNTGRNISAIAFSPLDPSRSYVLTNDGKFYDSLGVDGKWEKLDTVAPGSHYFYGSVIVPSRLDVHTLWIAGSGYSNPGVFVSSDDGKTFIPIDSGLPHTLIYGLAASENEEFLFAATEVGPYIYSKQANTWLEMSHGHSPDMVYWSVEYIPSLKVVRFGTYGRGIWDFTIDQIKNAVLSDSVCPPIPNFNLSAKPPLFSSTTDISFNLPAAGLITVHIFDLNGRLVRTIVNSSLDSGWHHYQWNGTSDNGSPLPSGFYTCIASGMGKADFAKIDLVR